MANRNFPASRVFGFHYMPVRLDCQVPIGATGAVGTISGPGIKSVTRLDTGCYRIRLEDNYADFLGMTSTFQAPLTGSSVAGGSFITGTIYQILTLGTTTQAQWETAGLPSGVTAAIGAVFKAAGAGAGTGTVKAIGFSGITSVELLGDPGLMTVQPFTATNGQYIDIKCIGPTNSSTTTPVATDPASGSTLFLSFWMNNSAVQ